MATTSYIYFSFWSLCEFVGDLRNHIPPFVRLSVSDTVSQKPFIIFSETLQLVSACTREKNAPSFFLKNFRFAYFGQKLPKLAVLALSAQKWRFSNFFSQSIHYNFLIFCNKHCLLSRKKWFFFIFEKIHKWPFLAKFGSFFP